MKKNFNKIDVPVFEFDKIGNLKPNLLFHRPGDKLHSRCIEYPFGASQIDNAQCILDTGTVKSDSNWIKWLESLSITVYATDYDEPNKPFHNIIFHQADIRKLPFEDNTFDKILAVSVIEHIGLEDPQVLAEKLPQYSAEGDIEAVRELSRVLKSRGELIMTFPFGIHDGLMKSDNARRYTIESVKKFNNIIEPIVLDYYEYQYRQYMNLYPEYESPEKPVKYQKAEHLPDLVGFVTWRKIPIEDAEGINSSHVDGVMCGTWRKI